jgi:hypothetical protein
VNQNSGEHTAIAIPHQATMSSSVSRRNRRNSSGINAAPAIALSTPSAVDAACAGRMRCITAVEAFPSAMKTG